MRSDGAGTLERMGEPSPEGGAVFEVECPHCRKSFSAEVLEGSASRYRGFKCPHCRLFVPYERAEERALVERVPTDVPEAD